jgi:hypothetical protein
MGSIRNRGLFTRRELKKFPVDRISTKNVRCKDIKTRFLQADRKVTQSILKYLLMFAIQYNSTELINTQYRCDYTRAHAGHVILYFKQLKC